MPDDQIALIAFSLKEGGDIYERVFRRGDELVAGLFVHSLSSAKAEVEFKETRTWHETVDAKTQGKLDRINEIMASIENDIFAIRKDTGAKKGQVYGRKEHGGILYAGTNPEGGVIAIRFLQRRPGHIMAPDKKFGDIGAGIGRIGAYAAVLSEVGEIVLIEPDPYLVAKGKEAIEILHGEGILDKSRIRWVQETWMGAIDEIGKLDAAFVYSPLADDMSFSIQADPQQYGVRKYMKKTAYLLASNIPGSGWGEISRKEKEISMDLRGLKDIESSI